jgi:hypothetical protein
MISKGIELEHREEELYEFEALIVRRLCSAVAVALPDIEILLGQYIIAQAENPSLRTFFRELTRCKEKVKSLHRPLLLVPHSLHPAESAAH